MENLNSQPNALTTPLRLSRRQVATTAVWAVPAVGVAMAAPAASASVLTFTIEQAPFYEVDSNSYPAAAPSPASGTSEVTAAAGFDGSGNERVQYRVVLGVKNTSSVPVTFSFDSLTGGPMEFSDGTPEGTNLTYTGTFPAPITVLPGQVGTFDPVLLEFLHYDPSGSSLTSATNQTLTATVTGTAAGFSAVSQTTVFFDNT